MLDKITATVLVDNVGTETLGGEWGLSVYIQAGEKTILLDAGGSELFARNAEKLGLSIADVDYAVLSHAHYDHSLGMAEFFRLNRTAKFYVRESTAENCYGRRWIFRRYIGLPKHILSDYADRIETVSGDYRLTDDVYLIPHHTPGLDAIGRREQMARKVGWSLVPDDFSHEQSLVFDTSAGLVIFNSCSHGGAAAIIREVSAVLPGRPVCALVGGLHLFNKTDEEIRAFAAAVRETGITRLCTGHCTKERALGILREELGGVAEGFRVGYTMEFGKTE